MEQEVVSRESLTAAKAGTNDITLRGQRIGAFMGGDGAA